MRLDRHAKYFLFGEAYERAATVGFRCAYDGPGHGGGGGGSEPAGGGGGAALLMLAALLLVGAGRLAVPLGRWRQAALARWVQARSDLASSSTRRMRDREDAKELVKEQDDGL